MGRIYSPCPTSNGMAVSTDLRIPPQNVDSERALLGAVMLRPEAMHEIIDVMGATAFYMERHRLIFETMLELFSKNNPIDLLSLSSRLREKNLLEQIGGASYLSELVGLVPSASNARHYAELVSRAHTLRQLIEAAEQIREMGFDQSHGDIEEALDQAEQKVYEIGKFGTTRNMHELKELLGDAWERIAHLNNAKDELRGIRTGFHDLDNKLAGLQKSDLIIIAARPSVGKSALALDIARQTATKHGNSVCFFSLEMSSQQLVDRMLAAEARVNSWRLRTGRITGEQEFKYVRDALDRLSVAPIYIDDGPGNNILKMRAVARRLKREKDLKLIIVDYLQLMTPIHTRTSDSAVQQVTELSRSLKHLARELDLPVIALSQLSRAVEQRGGKPRLSDLRDSGSIEQDADVVMFLHRGDKEKEDKNQSRVAMTEILIEKHRNGPTGMVELMFDSEKATFLPVDKSHFGPFKESGATGEAPVAF